MQSRAGEDEGGDNVRALIQGNRAKFYAGEGRACSEQKKVPPAGSMIESGVVSNSAVH